MPCTFNWLPRDSLVTPHIWGNILPHLGGLLYVSRRSHMPSPRDAQIVCLLDVLGFENQLTMLGLDGMYAKYAKLVEYVKAQTGGIDIVPTPSGQVAVGWLVIGNAYFSDSLLFWTRYSKMALPSFTNCIAQALCFGLENELPLRGSIAVGDAILDEKSGMFLGDPLVEVARGERSQQWIGASFGPSFSKHGFNDGFHLNTLLPYKSQYKSLDSDHATGMAVDWPRVWRESRKTDPTSLVRALNRDPNFSNYYETTERFVAFSEQNHDWFRNAQHLAYG